MTLSGNQRTGRKVRRMAQIETWLKCDLKKPVKVHSLDGNVFSADSAANLIGVEIYDNGQAAQITGAVHGYAIREDGATVIIDGTLSGNKASVILPLSCYTVVGRLSVVIKVGTMTVGAVTGNVYRSTTDTIVDPAHIIPSIDELLAKIAACEAATANANTAASNANSKATVANTAADNANTAASAANTAANKIDRMTADAESLGSGASASATVTEVGGHKHVHFGIPRGANGRDGVISSVDLGMFAMQINADGDLICIYSDTQPALSINSSGDLIYTV